MVILNSEEEANQFIESLPKENKFGETVRWGWVVDGDKILGLVRSPAQTRMELREVLDQIKSK